MITCTIPETNRTLKNQVRYILFIFSLLIFLHMNSENDCCSCCCCCCCFHPYPVYDLGEVGPQSLFGVDVTLLVRGPCCFLVKPVCIHVSNMSVKAVKGPICM